MKKKTGIVDVGGGMRGIYAAGVFDFCLDAGIRFDLGIGVSAGSANLVSFAAGQSQRNQRFFAEYSQRKQYMGWENFIRKGSFLDLDYIYGTLSNSAGVDPLNYPAFMANPMEILMVATEAESGNPKYFSKNDISQDNYDVLKASCAIPYVCKPQFIDMVPYYDGALGDTIPFEKAFELGCDKVVLVLTLPLDTVRTSKKDKFLAARIRKTYPMAAHRLEHRAGQYNVRIAQAKKYADQGKLLFVAPDNTCGVTTLKRKPNCMARLYAKGYSDGHRIVSFLTD